MLPLGLLFFLEGKDKDASWHCEMKQSAPVWDAVLRLLAGLRLYFSPHHLSVSYFVGEGGDQWSLVVLQPSSGLLALGAKICSW